MNQKFLSRFGWLWLKEFTFFLLRGYGGNSGSHGTSASKITMIFREEL